MVMDIFTISSFVVFLFYKLLCYISSISGDEIATCNKNRTILHYKWSKVVHH